MAVIKHIASKNADYGESERYLIFQHNEYTQKPILDDEGHMILRDEYYLDGLNCDPFTFASECQELNSYYHKNKNFNEIKSHHYIISFDPKDREECGLTGERAQQLGLTFAKKNFPGHQALVCTHTDGHNESGNIHVHIVINSLRKYDVPKEPYMEFDCESKAGYKHHLSTAYLAHLKQDVMDMCQNEAFISRKIRINAIAPGMTKTGLTNDFNTSICGDAEKGQAILEKLFLAPWNGRWASAEEMGYPMAAVGSHLFSYMSGQILYIDYGTASTWEMDELTKS